MSTSIFVKHVFPLFISLCDDSNWGVRKGCSESIGELAKVMKAKHSPTSDQITSLFIIIDKYIKDESKYVKLSMYKEFGKFIYEISMLNQSDFGMKIDKLIVNYLEGRENK